MGQIRAPPTNAVLAVPATISWEGHQHLVQAMIDSGAAASWTYPLLRSVGSLPNFSLIPRQLRHWMADLWNRAG